MTFGGSLAGAHISIVNSSLMSEILIGFTSYLLSLWNVCNGASGLQASAEGCGIASLSSSGLIN